MTDPGDLRERVNCQRRIEQPDGEGNTLSNFVTQFSVAAAYRHLRGGETVIASRLAGVHPMLVTVRSSQKTRQITTDWRLIDAHDLTIYAVTDVTHETDREWITLLCKTELAQ